MRAFTTRSTPKCKSALGYGLTVLSTYTWSRNTDGSNAANNSYSTQPSGAQDNNNLKGEQALGHHRYAQPLDQRHHL